MLKKEIHNRFIFDKFPSGSWFSIPITDSSDLKTNSFCDIYILINKNIFKFFLYIYIIFLNWFKMRRIEWNYQNIYALSEESNRVKNDDYLFVRVEGWILIYGIIFSRVW